MTNTTITNLRSKIFDYFNSAVTYNDVINVSTKNGNAVILSEQDYNNLIATVELSSNPKLKEKLINGLNTDPSECEEFKW